MMTTSRQSRFACARTAVLFTLFISGSNANSARNGQATIPRSSSSRKLLDNNFETPPWNPSEHIDEEGFLNDSYWRIPGDWEEEADIGGRYGPKSRRYEQLSQIPVTIRQVPGDGNCLFHSISTCLAHAINGTHLSMSDIASLRATSACLREKAVDCLQASPRRLLFLQGNEYLRARDLVDAAAAQYELTGQRYCELMRKESYWGGGPEIVALCNVLRRPIHVYELMCDSSHNFGLRRMACFGSPKFDRREPLHILSADSRFPDVEPGRQLASGNHFLAMFPAAISKRRAVVRGGGRPRTSPKEESRHLKGSVKGTSEEKASAKSRLLDAWEVLLQKLSSRWFFGI